MNVTLRFSSSQPAISRRLFAFFKVLLAAALALPLLTAPLCAETHWNVQAVNANGVGTFTGPTPFTVLGVLVTDPDEMLDSTPNFLPWNSGANIYRMGAEWQVVVQAGMPGDRLGTFCYMGQNYGNMPWNADSELSYTNEAWTAELDRLNHDPATGRAFRKGDLVSVTANAFAFYGGKVNIN
jgi:hypothetical protein